MVLFRGLHVPNFSHELADEVLSCSGPFWCGRLRSQFQLKLRGGRRFLFLRRLGLVNHSDGFPFFW